MLHIFLWLGVSKWLSPILVMAGYLYVFGFGLATLGFAKLVPLVAVLIASLAGVAFTFAKANGVLFS